MRAWFFGLLVIGQISCSSDDLSIDFFIDDPSITTLNGTWKVVSFEDFSNNTVEHKTQGNSWGKDIIVSFNDNLDPRIFAGQVATNSVYGEFEYVGERQFKLNGYASTFVSQPEWADKFGVAVTDGIVTFKINHARLRIYYENKTKSVTLSKQ